MAECEECGISEDVVPLTATGGALLCAYCSEAKRLLSEVEFEEDYG